MIHSCKVLGGSENHSLKLFSLFEVGFARRVRRRGWWRSQEFGSHSHGDRVFRKRDGDDDRYADRKTAIFRLRDRQQREKKNNNKRCKSKL